MKQTFINKSISLITKYKNPSEKELKIYKYGLEGLYNLTTKTLVVLLVTLLINTAKEFILILTFYALIRTFAFGIHAKSSIACWISTLTIYILGSILAKEIMITRMPSLIIWAIAFISFILWAPADTPKRPLIRKNQRGKLKIKVCSITLIYLILLIIIKNQTIINSITISLIIEMICINPLTYKITKTQFNNYRFYKKGS